MIHVLKDFAETFRKLNNVLIQVFLLAVEMVMVQYVAICQQAVIHVITVGHHALMLILDFLVALDVSVPTFLLQQLHQQLHRQVQQLHQQLHQQRNIGGSGGRKDKPHLLALVISVFVPLVKVSLVSLIAC